ncbi:MAG: xanthine dehydrogenase family protein molybdopterin-binding subunit, partial [Streptosporangiaceae bacterium]
MTACDEVPAGTAIGRPARKRGGHRLLTGQARFTDDYAPQGMVHAAVVRSGLAHARILSIDAAAASAAPGVLLVLTGDQAAQHSGPIPHFIDPGARGGVSTDPRCLAVGKVVYAGEPVAAVVAGSRQQAQAAAQLVEVRYAPLPFVLDPHEALSPGAPRLYEDWPDNVVLHRHYGIGDVDGALSRAEVIVTGTMRIGRQTSAPIEPRDYLASWDSLDGTLTVHASC